MLFASILPVSAFRRDVNMVGLNCAIVRRIESARRIVLRVDCQVTGLDVALVARVRLHCR